MHPEAARKAQINRGGFCVAASYFLVVVVVYAYIALTTKAENVGYDWIPFVLLAMPWYGIGARLLFPGLIANTVISYLLGMLFDKLWCRTFQK